MILKLLLSLAVIGTFLGSLRFYYISLNMLIEGMGVTTPDNLALGISFICGSFLLAISLYIKKIYLK